MFTGVNFVNKFILVFSLRLHKQKVHNAQNLSKTKKVNVTHLLRGINDGSLKEDLETCKHFLVNSEM